MTPPTDRSQLDDLRKPHSDPALAALMERHGAMVLATCERITGDRHDAEEAAQVVFLILMRKAGSLGGVECLAAWLHRTARFVALRARAARLRHRRREAPLVTAPEPATAVEEPDELRERLDAALDRLPVIYRETLLLHYVEGRNCEEIGQAVGASAETVAMRLSRGRELLRRRLRQPPTDAFTRTLGGLAAMPTIPLAPAALHHPSPAVAALLRQSLGVAKAAAVAATAMSVVAVALLSLGTVLAAQRLTAAETHSAPTPQPVKPATVADASPWGIPLCEPWEARLQAALQRQVTLRATDADALGLLRRLAERCELPMVVSLPPRHAPLGRVSLTLDGVPLEDAALAIGKAIGLTPSLRSGVLLWQEPARGVSISPPIELWFYPLELHSDASSLVDDLTRDAGVDFSREGTGVSCWDALGLFVQHSPTAQARVERFLAARPREGSKAVRGRLTHPSAALPTRLSDRPAEERRLLAALATPVQVDLAQPTLRAALTPMAQRIGVRLVAGAGVDLDLPVARQVTAMGSERMNARHAMELVLLGTDLHVDPRPAAAGGPSADDVVAIVPAGRERLVQRRFASAALLRAICPPRPGAPAADPEAFMDLLMKMVQPYSWERDGVRFEEQDGDFRITQTVAVQTEIEETLAGLGRALVGGDADARIVPPAAVTIELTARDF